MTVIDEKSLRFTFGKRWQVVKLDDSTIYRFGTQLIDGKAVDFVGILDHREIYFIEVKDFRGHRIENKSRLLTGDLLIEVAHKVRDSVACIVATARTHNEDFWNELNELFRDSEKPIKVILWFEGDRSPHVNQRIRVKAAMRKDTLNAKLKWLKCRAMITGIQNHSIEDLRVSNLPRDTE